MARETGKAKSHVVVSGEDVGGASIPILVAADGTVQTAGGGGGGGGAATIADGADVAEGATTDLAVVTDANGTLSGKLRGLVKWAFERMPASLGQKAMATSLPVVVASDQSVIPVSDNAGSLTVDAPVGTPVWVRLSDGAAAYVGQKVMASSLPVVIASDQSAVPVSDSRLPAALDADGGLKVHTQNVVHVDDNAGSLTVDAPVGTPAAVRLSDGAAFIDPRDVSDRAARLVGVVDTELETPAALADASGNPTLPRVGAMGMVWGGSSWDRLRSFISTGGLWVGGRDARGAAVNALNNPVMAGARAASYPTKPAAVAAGQVVDVVADLNGVMLTRPRQVATYVAIYRLALAAASSSLAFTFVANTDKQLATIHHLATDVERVTIRRVWVQIIKTGAVAGELQFELRELSATTAPATGNPAITPAKRDSSSGTAKSVCLALPTTAGSEVAANSPIASTILNLAASLGTASGTGLLPTDPMWLKLYDEASADDEEISPTIRSSVAEGWAVVGRSTAAIPLNFIVRLVFTEE